MKREGQVFLSHSGADTQAASQLAETLRRNGFKVWLDQDDLGPGVLWQQTIEEAIESSSVMIVYIGRLGVQNWVGREVRHGLVRSTANPDGFHLVPVLGDGADPGSLPPFLQQHQWADLRDPQQRPEQIRRLVERLRQTGRQQAIAQEYWTSHSPFRRLQSFEPDDSWLFFGRDAEIEELLLKLAKAPVLAVVGNSGSGKSSLIRAGLIPALQRGRLRNLGGRAESWRVAVVEPTESPFDYVIEALPEQLAPELPLAERAQFIQSYRKRLAADADGLRTALAAMVPRDANVLLVVDRFEALFAPTVNKQIQRRYIDALLAASRPGGGLRLHLVIVLRADFFGYCLDHGELSRCLAANLYNVQRLSPTGLRETIESRLALAAARAEEGLIETILSEVGAEPGDLALLEATLDELWERRELPDLSSTLTNHAYVDMGRLRGALERHADKVLAEIGGPAEQDLVKRLFLQLVQLGDAAPDTRRRVSKRAVLELGPSATMERLLDQLAMSRLIQTGNDLGQDFVEVSHEALIREWPTLRHWLDDNREALRFERRLLADAEEWQRLHQDSGSLLRSTRLQQAKDWLKSRDPAPGPARDFVEKSLVAQTNEEKTKRRRYALGVTAAGSIVLLLVSFALVMTIQSARLARERDTAREVSTFLTDLFNVSDPREAKGNDVTARRLLDKGAERIRRELRDKPEVQAKLMDVMGNVYNNLGLYGTAESLLRDALQIQTRALGRQNEDVAAIMNDLGIVLLNKGQYPDAVAILKKALTLRRKLLGDGHRDVAATMTNLANALMSEGHYPDAEVLFRESLALRRKLPGGDQRDIPAIMGNLASVLWVEGHSLEAEARCRDALALLRRTPGKDPAMVVGITRNLAGILNEKGSYEEAEQLFGQVLETERHLLGEGHPEVAIAMNGLADVLRNEGKYTDAEKLLRDALALQQQHRLPENDIVWTKANLAGILEAKGDYSAAEALFHETLTQRQRLLPSNHPELAQSLTGLGTALTEEGHADQGEIFLREAREILRKAVPQDHPNLAFTESALAGCLIRLHKFGEAESLLRKSYPILRLKLSDRSPDTQRAQHYIVELYAAERRTEAPP